MIDPIVMTASEYEDHRENYDGICLNCGEWTDGGCEPDMRSGECDSCGASKVHGVEEVLMMGLVEIEDD